MVLEHLHSSAVKINALDELYLLYWMWWERKTGCCEIIQSQYISTHLSIALASLVSWSSGWL